MQNKILNERDVVLEILLSMNALTLPIVIYYDLERYVKKGLYAKAILYLGKQLRYKNIRKEQYTVLMFVLKSADTMWSSNFNTLSK